MSMLQPIRWHLQVYYLHLSIEQEQKVETAYPPPLPDNEANPFVGCRAACHGVLS